MKDTTSGFLRHVLHTIHATTTTTTTSSTKAAEVEVKAEEAAETTAAVEVLPIVVCIKSNVCGYKTPITTTTRTQSSSSSLLSLSRRLEKSFEGFQKLCSHERRRVTESRVEKEGLRKGKGEKDLRSCVLFAEFSRERGKGLFFFLN